ncbi:MAG: potassium channel family protein [Chloroflexota bacterium]
MPISPEQQQALDELMRLVTKPEAPPPEQSPQADWLQPWLGVSMQDVRTFVQAALSKKDAYEQRLRDWVDENPLDANFEFIGIASWAFYQAEKGANPKINTYVDALYYITTCLSVGYADIFAVTQSGRVIAALVMTLGPSFTTKALERPRDEK